MSAEIQTLHIPFRQWLERERIAHTYHRPDRPTGATLGDADFLIHAAGRCLMLEFKDKTTRTSPGQLDRHAELARVGCRVHILRDLGHACDLVRAWLATIGEIAAIPAPTKGTTARAEPQLVRFGASVFRRTEGRLEHVRVATAADAHLPTA